MTEPMTEPEAREATEKVRSLIERTPYPMYQVVTHGLEDRYELSGPMCALCAADVSDSWLLLPLEQEQECTGAWCVENVRNWTEDRIGPSDA